MTCRAMQASQEVGSVTQAMRFFLAYAVDDKLLPEMTI